MNTILSDGEDELLFFRNVTTTNMRMIGFSVQFSHSGITANVFPQQKKKLMSMTALFVNRFIYHKIGDWKKSSIYIAGFRNILQRSSLMV